MRRVPNVTCTTNPCRIRYYTQDLVIFRDNLHQKMQRHALLPVVSEDQEEEGNDNGDEAEAIDVDGEAGQSQVNISKHVRHSLSCVYGVLVALCLSLPVVHCTLVGEDDHRPGALDAIAAHGVSDQLGLRRIAPALPTARRGTCVCLMCMKLSVS